MARSLALMVVVVAALLLLGPGRTLLFPGDSRRQPVSYDRVAAGFATVTGSPAVVPASLPAGWEANAATLTRPAAGARLHIGWATPGEKFAGLDESAAPPDAFIRTVLGRHGAVILDTIDIGSLPWDVRRSDRGETALTREFGAVTVVVTGDATGEQLRALAAALR
jgi:hypothetical protein